MGDLDDIDLELVDDTDDVDVMELQQASQGRTCRQAGQP